jgi:O-antigen ligase
MARWSRPSLAASKAGGVWLVAGGSEVAMAALMLRFHWGLWALAVPLLVLAALELTRCSPYLGAVGLILSSFVDRPEIPIGPAHLRLGELAALGLAVGVAMRLHGETGSLRGTWSQVRTLPLFWPIAAFLASNILSVAFSPNALRSVQLNMILISLALGYLGLAALRLPVIQVQRLLAVFAAAALTEAALGLVLLFVSARTHSLIYGVQQDGDSSFLAAMGSLNDANFFGSFLTPPFLLFLAALTIAFQRAWRRLAGACAAALFVLALAIFTSLTRGAWLGLVAGLLTFGLLSAARPLQFHRRAVFPALATAVAVIVVGGVVTAQANLAYEGVNFRAPAPAAEAPAAPGEGGPRLAILDRFKTALDVSMGSTRGRIELVSLALAEWKESPWLGVGTGSFHSRLPGTGRQVRFINAPEAHPWILTMLVTALHDTGLVGLLIVMWLILAYFLTLLRAAYGVSQPNHRVLLAGLLAGAAALFTAFQVSTGVLLTFPWLLMGLSVMAARQFALRPVMTDPATVPLAIDRGPSLVPRELTPSRGS